MPKIDARVAKEIRLCKADFLYFCKHYLKIVDKKGDIIKLVPNTAQQKYYESIQKNPGLYVLNARQLGLTPIIAAHNFWKTLFTPNNRVLVMAHTHVAAETIFKI